MKLALLGCSGWISHYLVTALLKRMPGVSVIGTYKTRKPAFNFPLVSLSNTDQDQVLELLEQEQVSMVVNMTRGENEVDFTMHQKLIDFGNAHGAHYSYASSFNACDAQLAHDHDESELPSAQSEYGKFKARCEQAMMADAKKFAIFRFSATHGWAPNRCARTEDFLMKISGGEKVNVHQGIVQNRTSVTDLADMMAAVIVSKCEGVFHLGTVDASDEIDFLKNLARRFGHDETLIVPDEESPTNANMVPNKILRVFGDEFRKTEADTIESVGLMPQFAQYHRRSSAALQPERIKL